VRSKVSRAVWDDLPHLVRRDEEERLLVRDSFVNDEAQGTNFRTAVSLMACLF
jgi:hypothetical protein